MNPFEHQVRERAYFIWEGEGREIGRSEDHWLRAEREFYEAAGPMVVQAAAADLTLTPSPTQTLDKALKTRASRARSASAKAAEPAAKTASSKPSTKAAPAKPTTRTKASRAAEANASIH